MSNSIESKRAVKAVKESAVNEIESNFQPRIPVPTPAAGGGTAAATHVSNVTNNTIIIDIFKNRQRISTNGLGWFATNWKTIAIAAAGVAAIYAIAKLIKGLNNNIKVRYNSCAKTLLRMQKDFTLEESGLSMKAVLPGVGSVLMDRLAHWFTASKGKGHFVHENHRGEGATMDDGVIGLYPFCNKYKDEITLDFKSAVDAFNKIAAAGETADKSTGEGPKGEGGSEAFDGTVYKSFREACRADHLNESISDEQLNEIALTAVSAAIGLGTLAIRGGMFLFSKIGKNGKAEDQKAVQVTKESTREVCYAILNNYGDRYVNMSAVFKQAGIDGNTLADVDKSSCDKLASVLKKYGEAPAEATISKQYARVKSMYDGMLKHYYNIGEGLINNFVDGTIKTNKNMDEKHKNLLVASKEKLRAMWDSQKDTYNNSFSRVMIEITSCENYQNYLNFIVERVIPVFKSGIAGDADYILDVMPKMGEYYVIRQTQQDAQAVNGEPNKGNVVLAKVQSFDNNTKEITFTLEGLIKSNVNFDADGNATIEDKNAIDMKAYRDGDKARETKLAYGKWLALDPHPTEYGTEEKKADEQLMLPEGPVDVKTETVDGKTSSIIVYMVNNTLIVVRLVDGKEVASARYGLPEGVSVDDVKKLIEGGDLNFKSESEEGIRGLLTIAPTDNGSLEKVEDVPVAIQAISKDDEPADASAPAKESKRTDCYAREYVPDYYAVLGLSKDANADEIRSAYKTAAMKYHPDKHAADASDAQGAYADIFNMIHTAYSVLSNDDKKKEYDEKNPGGTLVAFAIEAEQEVARSFTRPFSNDDSLNEDGESDSGEKNAADASTTSAVTTVDTQKADTSDSSKASDDEFSVVRVARRIGDKIDGVISFKFAKPFTAESFEKFITSEYAGDRDGEFMYKLGFTKLEGDASEYYNAAVTESNNVESGEVFAKIINNVHIDIPDNKTDAGSNDEDMAKKAEELMKEFASATYYAVVRDPNKKWAWIINPNPDDAAKKAVSDAKIAVSDVKEENGASTFIVKSGKIGFMAPGADEKAGSSPFYVKFIDNGYAAGENADAKADPKSVPVKMNAIVCSDTAQSAIVFGDGQWTPDAVADGLAKQVSALAKQGYKFVPIDQKSTAVNSSVDVKYDVNDTIEESAYDSMLTVNREISRLYKGYYILSESHVYDATVYDPESSLSESALNLMRTAKTKNDILRYAKSRKNVRFGLFETESSYKIRTSVKPSYYAPLYESVIAFRFDENNRVADYINFGVKVIY